jgi:hypothetical protein
MLALPEMVGFLLIQMHQFHLTGICPLFMKTKKGTQPNRLNPFDTAGARDENRTRTPIRARDFKLLALKLYNSSVVGNLLKLQN